MYRAWTFVTENSLLLVAGAIAALVWANTDPQGYHHFTEMPLWANDLIGAHHAHWTRAYGAGAEALVPPGPERVLSLHYLINDMLMAFFFAIAGKEVWEAVALRAGVLRGRRSLTPLIATAGGMMGPALVYLGLASVMGSTTFEAVSHGWAVPTATDIAFSYLVGRMVFGAGHPAVRFLLLLAIADDAGGLLILAIFYPTGALEPQWLLFALGMALAGFVLFNWLPRRLDRGNQNRPRSTWVRKRLGAWPYAVLGALSWYGFQESGIHPALGLLPMVVAIPHADRAFGVFAAAEAQLGDLLNRIQHMLKRPVELVLLLFGLVNAGVEFSSMGDATWLVLAGLVIGKPVGILTLGWIAAYPLRLGLPHGMTTGDLFVMGCVAGIGFTVSLFVASVAFDQGSLRDAAEMGALLSFSAAAIAMAMAKLIGVERRPA